MDDKSTPIDTLNRGGDDSNVVNNLLNKYHNMPSEGELPPMNQNIPAMERQMESNDINQDIYNHSAQDEMAKQKHQMEMRRAQQYQMQQQDEDYEDDEYEYYEDVPTWKKVVNEIKVPLFIFVLVIIFFSQPLNKMLIKNIPFFASDHSDSNLYGLLAKAFLVALVGYLLIKFVKV